MNNRMFDRIGIENIKQGEKVSMPSKYGTFSLIPFQENNTGVEHIALIKGEWGPEEVILTRIHSSCATGDIFGSLRCDCGDQLIKAMQLIEKNGKGAIIYLQQEGRGIGLMNKIKAYKLQENGMDTVDANIHLGFAPDERNYKTGSIIMQMLGLKKVQLLTNNPAKTEGLEKYGIQIFENIPLVIQANIYNSFYLETKQKRMRHSYDFI